MLALSGLWNSHLDMVRCESDGSPVPDADPVNLWTVRPLHFPDGGGRGWFKCCGAHFLTLGAAGLAAPQCQTRTPWVSAF